LALLDCLFRDVLRGALLGRDGLNVRLGRYHTVELGAKLIE
jgi:hypothetical protein